MARMAQELEALTTKKKTMCCPLTEFAARYYIIMIQVTIQATIPIIPRFFIIKMSLYLETRHFSKLSRLFL